MAIEDSTDGIEMPDNVRAAFADFDEVLAQRLVDVRALIFDEASCDPRIGPLTETLKWGQPAYLTEVTRAGTTLRLGARARKSSEGALFVNCRTTLVDDLRLVCGDALRFEGSRAICIPATDNLPEAAFRAAIRAALTYHLRKAHVGRGASVLS